MDYGICPNCENDVLLEEEPAFGIHVLCETCQTELVITWLNPIELELIDYEEYEEYEEFEKDEYYEDSENDEEDEKFSGEPQVESFQKIKKGNSGSSNGNGQTQKMQ